MGKAKNVGVKKYYCQIPHRKLRCFVRIKQYMTMHNKQYRAMLEILQDFTSLIEAKKYNGDKFYSLFFKKISKTEDEWKH